MKTIRFPQVLLLGNGLNRAYNDQNWLDLLENIKNDPEIDLAEDRFKSVPYPLLAVLATQDQLDTTLRKKKDMFCGAMDMSQLAKPIQRLLEIPFDHILTTNYSYEIERAADSRFPLKGHERYMRYIYADGVQMAESKYLLHTYNEIRFHENIHKIWHIHGEARKPNSIILGHYYYSNLLARYQELLKKRKNIQEQNQKVGKPPIIKSWLDAFIMGDVYVLGFGYDFSEMDLWWLLNRKKRENAEHGTVYYYEPFSDEKQAAKYKLLEAYGAEIVNLDYHGAVNYQEFYHSAIENISSRVNLA